MNVERLFALKEMINIAKGLLECLTEPVDDKERQVRQIRMSKRNLLNQSLKPLMGCDCIRRDVMELYCAIGDGCVDSASALEKLKDITEEFHKNMKLRHKREHDSLYPEKPYTAP